MTCQRWRRPVRWRESCGKSASRGSGIRTEGGPGAMSRLIVKNLPNGVSRSRGRGPGGRAGVRRTRPKDGGSSLVPECGGPEPSGVGPCSDLCKAGRVALIVIIIAVDYCHFGCLTPNPTVRLQADVSLHLMPRTRDPSMQLLTRVDPRGFSLPLPRLLEDGK